MVTSKTGTVQKFPKPRGRAPKNASGQPATWDPDRGEWTGVVKKTKPDGVPKPRGRAPLGATWDYDKGEWVGGTKPSKTQNAKVAKARGREEARRQAREERERQVSEAACPPRPCLIAVASPARASASMLRDGLAGQWQHGIATARRRADGVEVDAARHRRAASAAPRRYHAQARPGAARLDGRAGRLGQRDGRLGRRRQENEARRRAQAARAGTARRGVELRDGRVGGRRQDVGQEEEVTSRISLV